MQRENSSTEAPQKHRLVCIAGSRQAVNAYVDAVVRDAGTIDIVFNAIGPLAREYGGGNNAIDLTTAEFMVPLTILVKSQFITATATARQMKRQG